MKQLSKTILILAICLWAGNGTSLLKASTPIRQIHSITENPQQRHHRGKQTRQKHIMNDKDFNFLYKTIKKKSFDKDRLELLQVGVIDNYFTCRQCVRLMSLYKFDDDKLKILRIMAGHLVDMSNHNDILKQLDFDSNRRKALDILGFKHERNRGRF